MPALLGTHAEGEKVLFVAFDALGQWAHHLTWAPVVMSLGVALGIILLARLRPGVPWALVVVVLATVANQAMGLHLGDIGTIPAGLPAPAFPMVDLGALDDLILPAVAVAALAALESLLSATVADGMSVGRHDPDRELLGQGIANLAAPLFGGIPPRPPSRGPPSTSAPVPPPGWPPSAMRSSCSSSCSWRPGGSA